MRAKSLLRLGAAIALALFLTACGGVQRVPETGIFKQKALRPYNIKGTWYYPADTPNLDETGIASYYGPDGTHGKPTATGEIFDQNAMTAAHKTLPIPSYAEVTNLSNGRRVTVKVNDRGPFWDGRIIDMSVVGAKALGFYGAGLAKVRVQAVPPPVGVTLLTPDGRRIEGSRRTQFTLYP